jgi:hypothetical protein
MANTLADLRAQIRLVLASTDDWPNATIDGFIADAIRFHSAQFPRRWRYTLSLTTGTQSYALPGAHAFQGIRSVEYPTGESPQSYLEEVPEWAQEFQDKSDVYAVRGIDDDTAIESDTAAANILFAETVATGESAIIEYLGGHPIPTAGDDDAQITVPVSQWEALVAFVEFRAHWELETDEAVTLTSVSIILSQLGQEARMAWNRYKEIVNALLMQQSQSAQISWAESDDTQKRAY